MLRRCLQSNHSFGMCVPQQGGYTPYGTLLKILSCSFTPDGRSECDCIGTKCFRILEKSQRDGYAIAKVRPT
jgi:Lon protease-like protein